ncbi:hypothetical protein RCL1_008405 [Eukaryota sp. TZLM3-RCL]
MNIEEQLQRETPLNEVIIDQLLEISSEEPSLLQSLLDMYTEDWEVKISNIKKNLDSGNFNPIGEDAHSLKGASGNLGFNRLFLIFTKMQAAGFSGDKDSITILLRHAEEQFEPQVSLFKERCKLN